ncbi:unnamed protein product [Timema podura]|uniref:HAT C-terminal dimerisation domain-containing protein n=1 Tax=Timema podura TaxID=61482 RepID=A0ABN7P157_TIMPD|nr:unnamed protein product [Timema podura]
MWNILFWLLLVLPSSSCEAERSFSSLRRLKTYLRSAMIQESEPRCPVMFTGYGYGLNLITGRELSPKLPLQDKQHTVCAAGMRMLRKLCPQLRQHRMFARDEDKKYKMALLLLSSVPERLMLASVTYRCLGWALRTGSSSLTNFVIRSPCCELDRGGGGPEMGWTLWGSEFNCRRVMALAAW